jgi:hypothetical protein
MPTLAQRVVDCWGRQELTIASGATVQQLAEFEQSRGVKLPPSVREFYSTVNGMGGRDSQYDDDFFCIWSLADFSLILQELPESKNLFDEPNHFYLFADHSIGVVYYGMELTDNADQGGRVVAVQPEFNEYPASICVEFDTFSQFLEAYLTGPIANCM